MYLYLYNLSTYRRRRCPRDLEHQNWCGPGELRPSVRSRLHPLVAWRPQAVPPRSATVCGPVRQARLRL